MDSLTLGKTKITWLNGGLTKMDGGAMFGPVPKPLWTKKYPCNEKNQIELVTEPMLVEQSGLYYLIDAGIGRGRLSEKQKMIFGASEESSIEKDLRLLSIKPEDIDYVLMTHLHFDHVTGLVTEKNDELTSLYPNAQIIVENREWDAIRHPIKRTKGTYWEENWRAIESQIVLFDDYYEVSPGIELFHAGGHSPGLCLVKIEDGDKVAVHLSDIFPTHAHLNPLWVTAFDDYPLQSIETKEQWINRGIDQNWVFLFYHDAYYRALQFDKNTKDINWSLKRSKEAAVPLNQNTN
ncbi:MBL fold metallo-hydrolase [Alkalibacterium olivapovliticus]|uniref:Glyoxylase-like metal-dependent hydrolase (Beta-lactamase superfamily II) n=1 Tax=Alkalibacterium olivapovliticus TaxID=99907 RepID=A0A2T0W7Y7_9LACT|nr:MBL fold metallo-hydrolase [Alkalibacterium olivapovliticus]PRY82808.1 glyoxylase-like metal-dependent hydrolase (beta-lactamase superfamily II) [Alkalibacterium olivapovliticus]